MTAPTLPPEQLSPATTRANRVVLLVIGVILLVGGLAALLVGLGVFGSDRAEQPVLTGEASQFADDNAFWFWPLVALVAIIVGLLALWWLLIQARSNRVPTVDLEQDRTRGRTRVHADAVTDAVADEIESYRGVTSASARLVESSLGPRLSLRVNLDGRTDIGEVRRRVESQALAHTRTALSTDELPTRLELVVPR